MSTLIYRLGWISVLLLLAGALSFRLGWLPFRISFTAYGLGLLGCALVAVAAASAFIVAVIKGGDTGRWLALVIVCAIPVVVVVARVGVAGFSVPPIHDISTDTEHPPSYVYALRERRAGDNSLVYGGVELARQQRAGYPDIQTLRLQAPAAQVYSAVAAIVTLRGWTLLGETVLGETDLSETATGETAPGKPGVGDTVPWKKGDGRQLEAVATTPLLGFEDDIVIRVLSGSDGTVVDMRSASRLGVSDLGVNGERVRGVLQELAARFE